MTGQWLFAGNQRQVQIGVGTTSILEIISPALLAQDWVSTKALRQLRFLVGNTPAAATALIAKGGKTITVSGLGTVGATGGAGAISLFDSALGGFQYPGYCRVSASPTTSVNCYEPTLLGPQATYQFVVSGVNPVTGLAFSYVYNEVTPAFPALIAANFPVINSVSPASSAGFVPGTAVAINWTPRAGQNPMQADVVGTSLSSAVAPTPANPIGIPAMPIPQFSLNIPALGNPAGTTLTSRTTLPAVFPSANPLVEVGVNAVVIDGSGSVLATQSFF